MAKKNPLAKSEKAYGKKAKKWMQKASKRMEEKGTVGTFRAAAKRAGMSTAQYADKVLAKGSKASPKMKKKANFARNARKARH